MRGLAVSALLIAIVVDGDFFVIDGACGETTLRETLHLDCSQGVPRLVGT